MGSVEQWDPRAIALSDKHAGILDLASRTLDDVNLGLDDAACSNLRTILVLDASAWTAFVAQEPDARVIDWIKVLTLLEREVSGCECGARSPVLPLLNVLKDRKSLPADLYKWIKAHTNNRFLPYGNLLDRL